MIINYIILAHKSPKQVRRLIERLQDTDTYFYIHIDKKSNIDLFKRELFDLSGLKFVINRINVHWGHVSMVEATLNAIDNIIEDHDTGYCVLLSGQDYPIKSKKYIKEFLSRSLEMNYISLKPAKEIWRNYHNRIFNYVIFDENFNGKATFLSDIFKINFYTLKNLKNIIFLLKQGKFLELTKCVIKKREFPCNLKPYGGSQWWALPMSSILLINRFLNTNPSYMKYHKDSLIPDEMFFHSIIGNILNFKNISTSITHVDWSRKNCKLPVTFSSLSDFEELQGLDALFARKFNYNSEILNIIDKKLLLLTS